LETRRYLAGGARRRDLLSWRRGAAFLSKAGRFFRLLGRGQRRDETPSSAVLRASAK
jgi:hypothetical protein